MSLRCTQIPQNRTKGTNDFPSTERWEMDRMIDIPEEKKIVQPEEFKQEIDDQPESLERETNDQLGSLEQETDDN